MSSKRVSASMKSISLVEILKQHNNFLKLTLFSNFFSSPFNKLIENVFYLLSSIPFFSNGTLFKQKN